MLSRLLPFSHLYTQLQNPVWQAQSLGMLGQGEEERHPRGDTRTLQTMYVSQSDPGFFLTTRRESCAWSLDCTLLSGHLWSLGMTIPPSPKLLEPVHSMQQPQTGEAKATSSPPTGIPKAGILPGIYLSPRFLYCPALMYLHQQQTQWCILLLLRSSQQKLAWAVNILSSSGQNSSFTHTVASHHRRWICYKIFSKADSRSSLQDGAVPHRHEGSACTQCCLTGRRSPALEPCSYNQVYIPWPFHVLVFMPSRAASIIIFLEITFQFFLSLSNKSLG